MSDPDDPKRPVWCHLENMERIQAESPDWLTAPTNWVVTEKLHGFCGRFGADVDGVPWVGSRNNVVCEGASNFPEDYPEWPHEQLQGFVKFAAEHVVFLQDGETLFGEWAGKGIQKGIDYGKPDFYAFGLMRDGALVAWDDLVNCCSVEDTGIKTVPVIYQGPDLPPIAVLAAWREATSLIAETGREGICIAKDPPVREAYGHYLIGKFKSPEFAERARERNRTSSAELPDMTILQNFVDDYATEERFAHVLDQVFDANYETGVNANPLDARLTGDVLRTMYNDVIREAGSEYEDLADSDKKMLGKVLNATSKKLLDAARLAALGKAQ